MSLRILHAYSILEESIADSTAVITVFQGSVLLEHEAQIRQMMDEAIVLYGVDRIMVSTGPHPMRVIRYDRVWFGYRSIRTKLRIDQNLHVPAAV